MSDEQKLLSEETLLTYSMSQLKKYAKNLVNNDYDLSSRKVRNYLKKDTEKSKKKLVKYIVKQQGKGPMSDSSMSESEDPDQGGPVLVPFDRIGGGPLMPPGDAPFVVIPPAGIGGAMPAIAAQEPVFPVGPQVVQHAIQHAIGPVGPAPFNCHIKNITACTKHMTRAEANNFATDCGVPNPEQLNTKKQVCIAIKAISDAGGGQAVAAAAAVVAPAAAAAMGVPLGRAQYMAMGNKNLRELLRQMGQTHALQDGKQKAIGGVRKDELVDAILLHQGAVAPQAVAPQAAHPVLHPVLHPVFHQAPKLQNAVLIPPIDAYVEDPFIAQDVAPLDCGGRYNIADLESYTLKQLKPILRELGLRKGLPKDNVGKARLICDKLNNGDCGPDGPNCPPGYSCDISNDPGSCVRDTHHVNEVMYKGRKLVGTRDAIRGIKRMIKSRQDSPPSPQAIQQVPKRWSPPMYGQGDVKIYPPRHRPVMPRRRPPPRPVMPRRRPPPRPHQPGASSLKNTIIDKILIISPGYTRSILVNMGLNDIQNIYDQLSVVVDPVGPIDEPIVDTVKTIRLTLASGPLTIRQPESVMKRLLIRGILSVMPGGELEYGIMSYDQLLRQFKALAEYINPAIMTEDPPPSFQQVRRHWSPPRMYGSDDVKFAPPVDVSDDVKFDPPVDVSDIGDVQVFDPEPADIGVPDVQGVLQDVISGGKQIKDFDKIEQLILKCLGLI